MTASFIDLDSARAQRAAIVSEALVFMTDLARLVVNEAIAHADRAFAIADPAHDTDPELAREVYQAAHRRLGASLRRRLGCEAHPDIKRQVLEQAERVFRARVLQLEDDRDTKITGGDLQ